MTTTIKVTVSLLALAAAAAGIAAAVEQAPAPAGDTSDVLLDRIRPGAMLDQYVAEIVGNLRQADVAGDGLDKQDIAMRREQTAAQARASNVGEVLRQDLDGDLKVTRAEIERSLKASQRGMDSDEARMTQQVDNRLHQFDANGDGTITVAEAAAMKREHEHRDNLEALLALDPDGDGRLTSKELRRIAEKTFAGIDRNEDETISREEYQPFAERIREAQMIRQTPSCPLPAVPDGARLIAFGAYEGDAISSAVIGGPDEETNVIDVTIEPGSQPLYLVLTSYESMVWRLSGATNRIARVVTRSTAGIVGLPAGKVTNADCLGYFHKVDGESRRALLPVRRALGRDPDGVHGAYSLQRVALPSGQITRAEPGSTPMPRGFDAAMWQEAVRFWPGGLVSINPRSVVAQARVEPYKVLPSQMGLAQLVGSGAVQHVSGDRFRVVRPIAHMPPSMGGAHSVTLIIARGVPVPPGDPGHSCVMREDNGISAGARCRMSE